jgi:hypothetical protein
LLSRDIGWYCSRYILPGDYKWHFDISQGKCYIRKQEFVTLKRHFSKSVVKVWNMHRNEWATTPSTVDWVTSYQSVCDLMVRYQDSFITKISQCPAGDYWPPVSTYNENLRHLVLTQGPCMDDTVSLLHPFSERLTL